MLSPFTSVVTMIVLKIDTWLRQPMRLRTAMSTSSASMTCERPSYFAFLRRNPGVIFLLMGSFVISSEASLTAKLSPAHLHTVRLQKESKGFQDKHDNVFYVRRASLINLTMKRITQRPLVLAAT